MGLGAAFAFGVERDLSGPNSGGPTVSNRHWVALGAALMLLFAVGCSSGSQNRREDRDRYMPGYNHYHPGHYESESHAERDGYR